MLTILGFYAISFISTPYRWGGENAITGLDCSGFVQKVLKEVKLDPPGDQTAQGLYDNFKNTGIESCVDADCLLFFGKSKNKISHVAIALNNSIMIEAGGGDSTTRTLSDAIKKEARVRMKPISNRSDLVAAIRIKY